MCANNPYCGLNSIVPCQLNNPTGVPPILGIDSYAFYTCNFFHSAMFANHSFFPYHIMPICSTCKAIDLPLILENYKWSQTTGRSTLSRTFPHHETYSALRASAADCASCAIFYEPTNANPKYPNKPGIGEEDPVTLRLNRDSNYNSRVDLIGALQLCVEVWSKTERHRGVVSYSKYVDVWADNGTALHGQLSLELT